MTIASIVGTVGWIAPADGTATAQDIGSSDRAAEDDGDAKLKRGHLDEALSAFEQALGDCDDDACTARLHDRIASVERRIDFEAWQNRRRGMAAWR